MRIPRIAMALAIAAVLGPFAGSLGAQEFTLPPAPSSATEKGGTAFRAENGPCFYNPYSWMARGALQQTLIAAELQDLTTGAWSAGSGGCLGHFAVTGYDLFGPWSYMLSDGVPLPERVSQAKVQAVWEASRRAQAEGRPRTGHVQVPLIGEGHGSDEELAGRTLVLRVRPGGAPATYEGIPIIEQGRSWERFEAPDGRRVWREVSPRQARPDQPGIRALRDTQARTRSLGADRRIQREEGLGPMPRVERGAAANPDPGSDTSEGARYGGSTRPVSPRAKGKIEQ